MVDLYWHVVCTCNIPDRHVEATLQILPEEAGEDTWDKHLTVKLTIVATLSLAHTTAAAH